LQLIQRFKNLSIGATRHNSGATAQNVRTGRYALSESKVDPYSPNSLLLKAILTVRIIFAKKWDAPGWGSEIGLQLTHQAHFSLGKPQRGWM
jgi:hypothetical protein